MWELEILGLTQADAAFDRLSDGLENPESFLTGDAARIAGASVRSNFEGGGRPVPWPDITAKSRAQRRYDQSTGPEIDSGALMEAASADHPGVPGSVFSVQGNTLTLGTDLVQAAVQNDGWGEKNIPAREFETMVPEDEVRLAHAAEDDYLHRLLAA